MAYTEPPMKFNVGMRQYQPDLPQKPRKGEKYTSDKKIGIFILIVLTTMILLIILFWKLSNPA